MAKLENKRKAARTYTLKPTEIVLKGKAYRLNDISNEGFGIIIEEDSHFFFLGQRVDQIPVQLEEGTEFLRGVVAHISKNKLNKICGIKFLFRSKKEFEAVGRYQAEIKVKV